MQRTSGALADIFLNKAKRRRAILLETATQAEALKSAFEAE